MSGVASEHIISKSVPIGNTVYCELRREKPGIKDDEPIFILYSNATQQPILYCMRSSFSEMVISVGKPSEGLFWEKAVARLRSNFTQTKSILYAVTKDEPEYEMASIRYVRSSVGLNGPRKMSVILPPLRDDETFEKIAASDKDGCSVLVKRQKEGQPVITLTNKEPVWCEETGSYVLNFDGRVSFASIKNFQLVHPRDRKMYI